MPASYYLTPGPSELYFTVTDHLQQALREKIPSISHRSKAFEAIYAHAESQVRALLGVPEDFYVVFTSSATEVWERLLQNCVDQSSYHLVNGSFSKRFFDFAQALHKKPTKLEASFGEGFYADQLEIPTETELVAITQNETSAGVMFPVEEIANVRAKAPEAILAIDAVSSVPYPNFDYQQFDTLYFSVQKGMGLPAGLGVWIFNQRCVDKAQQLLAQGKSLGTYHTIPSLLEKAGKNQTPETPNVLNLYLLGKIAEDMLRRGVAAIRQEINYKAALLYNLYEQNEFLEPLVKEKKHRSKTVAVAKTKGSSQDVIQRLGENGLVIGSGYGQYKNSQIRIANFPTHSKELVERLVDLLAG